MAASLTTASPAPTPPGSERLAIEVAAATKKFGSTTALDAVSLTVAAGESRALVGRNGAGKSTLVSLLTGIARPDGGSVKIADGPPSTSGEAVACVYQRSGLVPTMTVAENVMIGEYPRLGGKAISWRQLGRQARTSLEPWGLTHLADVEVAQLNPVDAKVVEICRALKRDPSVLLLDEPTAGLDKREAERLFGIVGELRARGVTLLYVSHHLEEIFRLCETVTVLRDARHVLSAPLAEMSMKQLVEAMVGEEAGAELTAHAEVAEVDAAELAAKGTSSAVRLRIDGLSCDEALEEFSLEIRAGECVGIAGLDGSGKTELASVLAGLRQPSSGRFEVDGKQVPSGDARASLAAGIAFVPPDRHALGMVPMLDVSENATMTAARGLSRRLFGIGPRLIFNGDRDRVYGRLAEQWEIVAASARQEIASLSGGNQQKCVMARAIATEPTVLVMHNPTAGIDVAAKASITDTLREIFAAGACGLVISEDPDDFVLCSRVAVLVNGKVTDWLETDWTEGELVAEMQGGEQ